MQSRTPATTALRLARAEIALREQWSKRNLYLTPGQTTPNLTARKQNARSAIRWYVGEIRSLRSQMPGFATSGFNCAPRTVRGTMSGYPVQLWTRAVSTSRPAAARASWIPLPGFNRENPAAERPSGDKDGPVRERDEEFRGLCANRRPRCR